METGKWKRSVIWDYLLFAAVIIVLGLIVYTNLFHYCYKMNSDIGSEAALARLIWESGEFMPKSWFPGSELRLWQTPNLAALYYGLTHSMSLAMGMSCTTMTICIALSAYFFVSQLPVERPQKLTFVLLCLIIPNHFVILELAYLFASYYAVHIVIMFYTLGIYIRLISGKRFNVFFLMSTSILAVLMGMLSVREILILYMPLFITEVIRQAYMIYKGTWKDRRNIFVGGWCFLLLMASYIGTCFPFSVGQGVSRNIRKGFIKLIESVFPDVLTCLGLSPQSSVQIKILVIITVIFAVISLFLCCRKILGRRESDDAIWAYFMLWISPLMTMFAAAFTTMDSSERYYFVFVYTLSFGLVYLIKEVKNKSRIFQGIIYAAILFLFVIHIKTIYVPIVQSEEPFPDSKYEVVKYLEDNGLQTGYANFWLANSMTTLSDGAVRVAAVASLEKMNVNRCLSSTEWYVPNVPYESRTAYIVTESEKDEFEKFYEQHRDDLRFDIQIGQFLIYESDYNFSCLD